MKYTIDKLAIYDKDRDGNFLKSAKSGKLYKKVLLTLSGEQCSFLDGYGASRLWKVGDEIDGEIVDNNGYKNFKPTPKNMEPPKGVNTDFKTLIYKITKLEMRVSELEKQLTKTEPEEEQDLPF